ncbi:MAG: phosphoribosyltransferase [Actinomycetota bacterium]
MGSPDILVSTDELDATVRRLGEEIADDYPQGVLLIGVLKGALLFLADLARRIPEIDVNIDFMAISRFAPDSGRVRIMHDVGVDIGDRDVVLVEDIVDTGLTLAYLMGQLSDRAPRSLHACALLDRPSRRIVPHELRYRGIELREQYVLGYGLHVQDLYRNLPFVAEGQRGDVLSRPDCYVPDLYGGGDETRGRGGSVSTAVLGHPTEGTEQT